MDKNELLKKIYSKIDELPTLPVVVPKLLTLIDDEKSTISDLADTITRDPALTSKILKVANSAYYGFSKEISALKKAILLLGYKMVRSLALSIGVINNLPSKERSRHFSREHLWIHSLASATVMQELGKKFSNKDDGGYLFVVGLLHDIGKIVLDLFFTELFQQAMDEAQKEQSEEALHLFERKIIGIDHGEVGHVLLTRWKFPDIISAPIAVHHSSKIPEGINSADVAMLKIADALTHESGQGSWEAHVAAESLKTELDALKMTVRDLADLKGYLDNAKDGIHAFYSAMDPDGR